MPRCLTIAPHLPQHELATQYRSNVATGTSSANGRTVPHL